MIDSKPRDRETKKKLGLSESNTQLLVVCRGGGQAPLEMVACQLLFPGHGWLTYRFEAVTHQLVMWLMTSLDKQLQPQGLAAWQHLP